MPTDPPVTPTPAATVIVLRDRGDGPPHVLMLRRHGQSGFAADSWVFPGGAVDAGDRRLHSRSWEGIDPAALAPRFATDPAGVLGFHVAAVRESFEEAGLLFARRRDGAPGQVGTALARRHPLADPDGTDAWEAWLRREDLVLQLGALTYCSRWVTPVRASRRFDTCFFLARLPGGQTVDHDRGEITSTRWMAPADALREHAKGDLPMMFPTQRTLEHLATAPSASHLIEEAARQSEVRSILPHVVDGPDGGRILHPEDPGYPHDQYAGKP